MNLDEAIKHCEEVADYDCYNEKQLKCAEEHRQFAEWLKDYKRLKEQEPSVAPKPKIGRWIKTPKAVMGEGYMWYCDKCEHQVYQDSSRPYPSEKYCPNCGAEMAESEE